MGLNGGLTSGGNALHQPTWDRVGQKFFFFQWCGVWSCFVGFGAAMWGSEPLMWGSEVSFANNGVRRSEMWGSPSLPHWRHYNGLMDICTPGPLIVVPPNMIYTGPPVV